MIDRRQRVLDSFDRFHGGRHGAADHEDFDAEHARRFDLRIGGVAAAVLGDYGVDAMVPQKRQFGIQREGAAVENEDGMIELQGRRDGIDAADQIEMLRSRLCRMRLLPAGRQEDAARRGSKCLDRFGNGRGMRPAVARLFAPERAAQGDGGNTGHFCSLRGIRGNSGGKGMRGIDEQVKFAFAKETRKSFDAAETTNPHGNRLFGRFFRTSGKRQQDIGVGALPQRGRQLARLARAAQYQNAEFCHV